MTTAQVLIFFYHSLLPPLGVLLYHLSPCVCINGHFMTCDIKWVRKKSFLHLKKEVNWCFEYKMLWFFVFLLWLSNKLLRCMVHAFQHTGFGNTFQSFAMRNLRNDDRNGVKDVRHWHIYPEKQLYFLNTVLHTPHISVLHIYFFDVNCKRAMWNEQVWSPLEIRSGHNSMVNFFSNNFTFLTTWNNSFL